MNATTPFTGYVRTSQGDVFVQKPADNRFGFSLFDDDQEYPGGLNIGSTGWTIERDVTAEERERLDWLLAE